MGIDETGGGSFPDDYTLHLEDTKGTDTATQEEDGTWLSKHRAFVAWYVAIFTIFIGTLCVMFSC